MRSVRFRFVPALQWLILLTSAVYNFQLFAGTKLYGNAASRVLVAAGPLLGIGSPYKDLYELVPPGYLMFIAGWMRAFGLGMDSFRLIQVVLVLLNGWLLIKVLEKLFKNKWLQLFVFTCIIVTVHSWVIQTDFFSIDFFATTFVLGGLAALLYIKNQFHRMALAVFCFLTAGQMKDIYILSGAALLPFYLEALLRKEKRDFGKLVLVSAGVLAAVAGGLYLYLTANQSFEAYLGILQDKTGYAKTDIFSPRLILNAYLAMLAKVEENFALIPSAFFGLLALNAALIAHRFQKALRKISPAKITAKDVWEKSVLFFQKQLKDYGTTEWGRVLLAGILIAAVLYGLSIYGLYHGSQLIMIVTSYYLIIGILLILPLQSISHLKPKLLIITATALLFAPFVPKHIPQFFSFIPMQRDYPFEIEKKIIQRVGKDECILHIHGWEIAISYIYTQRRPCSRYFLSNELFNIRRPGVIEEYREHLIANPPAAVLYNEKGSDMDIERFDSQIVNFRKVLQNCYDPDPDYTDYMKHFFAKMTLYWPKDNLQKSQLQSCWENNIL